MKRIIVVLGCLALIFAFSGNVMAGGKGKCTTIQSGGLVNSAGDVIVPGYDEWGYNYQAHMFNGMWCDYHPYYRLGGGGHDWCMENMADAQLMMKWSDEWLSNKDCNGDGSLDRGYSCDPINANNSGCPGAWLTNHEWGTYVNDAGEECEYYIFTKIITPGDDAYVDAPYDINNNGTWYTSSGEEIGAQIWGAFAVIQEVVKDPCEGAHGISYISPAGTGLGFWNQ
ncbi:MAG: hypothetical protein ISS59_04995 [Desulfobacteraceae bacterium]|nr:hypothetical protein [Desulfobacteraceae bacterium]